MSTVGGVDRLAPYRQLHDALAALPTGSTATILVAVHEVTEARRALAGVGAADAARLAELLATDSARLADVLGRRFAAERAEPAPFGLALAGHQLLARWQRHQHVRGRTEQALDAADVDAAHQLVGPSGIGRDQAAALAGGAYTTWVVSLPRADDDGDATRYERGDVATDWHTPVLAHQLAKFLDADVALRVATELTGRWTARLTAAATQALGAWRRVLVAGYTRTDLVEAGRSEGLARWLLRHDPVFHPDRRVLMAVVPDALAQLMLTGAPALAAAGYPTFDAGSADGPDDLDPVAAVCALTLWDDRRADALNDAQAAYLLGVHASSEPVTQPAG